jgi:hypothetical protein
MPYKNSLDKKINRRKHYLLNKESILEKNKKRYLKNKKKYLEINKKYYLKNREQIIEKTKEYKKQWRLINKDYSNNYKKQRRKIDIKFKILMNLRTRINSALKGNSKSKKTLDLLGVPNIEFLKQYLENKFTPGMSWEKRSLIHIDHIRPCASFDLKDPKQQAKCFHYTNLQPLWAYQNLSKGAKILKSYK